ncbi:MAG: protein-disulfide isomerase [Alphaproteobacteria bacterium]|jgi:protein-disulfide isomerase
MDHNNNQEKKPISDTKKYGLLGIAAVLLIGAYFVGQSININETYNTQAVAQPPQSDNMQTKSDDMKIPKKGDIITTGFDKRFASDQIQGDLSKTPKVTLIEYGSLTCPHCASFHKNALATIKDDYINSKKIQYIYRDYPLDGAALKGSLLAQCDSSKRAAFIDLLYKKQAEWTRGKSLKDVENNLIILGKMGGLSAEKVQACFDNKTLSENIIKIYKESGQLFDISATPTIIINNQKFTGGLDAKPLKQTLDIMLGMPKNDQENNQAEVKEVTAKKPAE